MCAESDSGITQRALSISRGSPIRGKGKPEEGHGEHRNREDHGEREMHAVQLKGLLDDASTLIKERRMLRFVAFFGMNCLIDCIYAYIDYFYHDLIRT